MKVRTEIAIDGKEVSFLTPENDTDIETLQKMEIDGELSTKNSFGDWKNKS